MMYTPYPSAYGGYGYQQPAMPYGLGRSENVSAGGTQVPTPTTPPLQTGFLCRPVTSREEALAVQVDYLSAGTVMPDLGHGMIYLKRFDGNTGLSSMYEFAAVPVKQQGPEHPDSSLSHGGNMVSVEEQLRSVSERIDLLAQKLDALTPASFTKEAVSE